MVASLDFRSDRFYFFFYVQVTLMLPTKFRVNWPFSSGEEVKNRYQDGGHGGHLEFRIDRTILAIFDLLVTLMATLASILDFRSERFLAIFDLQVTQMLPTKFRVNWPFGSGENGKNRLSRWPPWWPSWISDQNDFSYF